MAGPPDRQRWEEEAPIITAYRRRLHEVHRLAEQLDRLRLDGRFDEQRHSFPPELHDELADAIEVLAYIRDALPADAGDGADRRHPGTR